jgi:beta-N-acetylhexosaminidase/D-alanyl-D-alanine dipeptidase
VAERLVRVQGRLRERGLGLKMWDCYRPLSVQERLWKLLPDGRYVARPVFRDGVPVRGSKHNRGAAVDVTLVDGDGLDVPVPTDHDDFSERAHRDYRGGSPAARRNARVLRRAMKAEGFTGIASEWWHFDGPGWRGYPLEDRPL